LYDVNLGQCYEDVNLNIAVALRSEVRHVAKRLVGYRIHPAQVSADEARVRSQEARLYRKWTGRTDLCAGDAARIAAAERFRAGRLALRLELIGAKRELKAGRFAGFCRHGWAAVKRLLATSR
jgi:Iap family predicted aminopeptidase